MSTAVLVCGDGAPATNGAGPGPAHAVPGLCSEPEQIRAHAAGATRLVLGLCGDRYALGPVQRDIRRVGLDPLGVEIVDLRSAAGDPDRLAVLLAAATARAESFAGSSPEHAKLRFPTQTSRRALLTFALPEYVAAPAVDPSRCAADRGCRACVDVCPQQAITITNGHVVHDRSVCEPCGRCVTACPTGATENPAATPTQLEAEVRALLDPGAGPPGPRGVVYRCRRSGAAETMAGWYPVTLPCTGMVPAAWLLAPLALGAAAVAVRPCSHGGCPLGHDDLVHERVAWARSFLAAAGHAPDLVATDPTAAALGDPLPRDPLADPFGPAGAAGILLALARAHPERAVTVDAPGSALGLVTIRDEACTRCGTCAAVCPTGALGTRDAGGRRSITFDATRCVACGVCTQRCPERDRGAIHVRPAVDVAALARGRVTLVESDLTPCEACGRPVAPSAMLSRLVALIDDERVAAAISRRCQDCRGLLAS